ncbi:MAG: prepilin-type N-terminal cleavage/methylation domain-containing protein [Candidatus Saccharimonadales bacterium]
MANLKTNTKARGFTIVELLVVIVVIGILAAITIVSYSGITARANTQANKSNANSVIQAAQVVYANTGAYPVTDASAATVLSHLNASDAKVPATLVVTSATVTATPGSQLSYRVTATGTGFCVGYWDSTIATPAPAYIYSGTATADNGTCS